MAELPKEKFFNVYANLPVGLRDQVVIVVPEVGPMSWNAAYIEINNDTKLGDMIVEKLIELKII
ncbi:MAG: hypothetical protein NTV48_01200 [Candidatus Vogelbacteria bacterium]|nr:hypothetical protein [Candidatus Vogelbacteria bacterium]